MGLISLSPRDIGWGNSTIKVPPEGFFSVGRYWRAKVELKLEAMIAEGEDSHPYFTGGARRLTEAVSTAVRGQEEASNRSAGVSLLGGVESELNSNRIEEMGSAIIEGKGLEGAI
ncbi:MAG: hypothetical protein U5J83_00855 [Bryobacterales bacterium]|nr:hypothetical protein [Bryobacterales bacterium]